jgi:hypothetical protein
MAGSVPPTRIGVDDLVAEFVNTSATSLPVGSQHSAAALVVVMPEPSAGALLFIDFASVAAIGLFFRRRCVKR